MGLKRLFAGSRRKSIAVTLLSALFPFVILAYLLYQQRDTLKGLSWQLKPGALFAIYPLLFIGMMLAAFVWSSIMKSLGSRLDWRVHLRNYVLSQLMKRLPGTIWYIAGRGYLYKQSQEPARLVTLASGVEYIITGISGILVILSTLTYSLLPISHFQLWALVGIFVGGLLTMHPKLINWTLQRLGYEPLYRGGYQAIIGWVLVYSMIWIMGGAMLFLILWALAPVSTTHFAYVVGSWSLVGVLSLTLLFLPTNLGFSELGFSYLLSRVVATPYALAAALLIRLLLLTFELLSAALILPFVGSFRNATTTNGVYEKNRKSE